MVKLKILIGIAPKTHVSLYNDEIEGLQNLGYSVEHTPYGRNNKSVSNLNKFLYTIKNALKIVAALYREKPAILYLNSRFEPVGSTRDFITLFIIKLFYFRKLKIIVKSHGSDYTILTRTSFFYKKMVIPFLSKQVDVWLFLSSDEKALITNHNSTIGNKIKVVPNIIEPNRCVHSIEFQKEYGINTDKFNLLYVGRMVTVKGIFDIINSIQLIQHREKIDFIFVGDGDDYEKLKLASKNLGVENQVAFKGFIPDATCDHFYANTDVLIYPTYDTEGFPMALFKSVAKGMPVITTCIRAAKDHLNEPENVIWVEAQSPQSIANAIDRLYSSEELRKKIGKNNLELGKNFSKEKVALLMDQIFSSI